MSSTPKHQATIMEPSSISIIAAEREDGEECQEEAPAAAVVQPETYVADAKRVLDEEIDTLEDLMKPSSFIDLVQEEQDVKRAVERDFQALSDAGRSSLPVAQHSEAIGAVRMTVDSKTVYISKEDFLREEERLANEVMKARREGGEHQRPHHEEPQADHASVTSVGLRDSVQGIPGAFSFIGVSTDMDPTLQRGDDEEAQQQPSEPQPDETDANQHTMPVANLVVEQSLPTAEARQLEPGQQKNKFFAFLCSASLVVIFCAIILAVVLTVNRGNDGGSSKAFVAPANKTSQPLPMYKQVLRLLPDETVKNIEVALGELGADADNWWTFQTSNFSALTPQQKAYQWILQDPNITSFSDRRIVQRFSLATFYHATGGPNWRNSDHWLSYKVHECDWYHTSPSSPDDSPDIFNMKVANDTLLGRSIPCSDDASYEFLRLKENNLDGTLPMELMLLSDLRGISLEDQNIYGTIPSHIYKLRHLEEWFMYNTALTGTIPTVIGLLTNMMVCVDVVYQVATLCFVLAQSFSSIYRFSSS